MKRQIRSVLLALALAAFLTGFALPGLAGAEIKVNVVAAEYNNNLLVASVVAFATEGEELTDSDVQLFRNGATSALPAVQHEVVEFRGAKLWKLVVNGNVIEPRDSLTAAIVSEGGVELGRDAAACGAGFPRLRITAICK